MKKLFSLIMAILLVMNLFVCAITPALAAADSGSGKYDIHEDGKFENIPIVIYGFTTGNASVKVKIGATYWYYPVTHTRSGTRTISTIEGTWKNVNTDLTLSEPYKFYSATETVKITISYFGNTVPTHTIMASGQYTAKSNERVCLAQTDYEAYYGTPSKAEFTCKAVLSGQAEGGYYSTRFNYSVLDTDCVRSFRNVSAESIQLNGHLQQTATSSYSGAHYSGKLYFYG